MGEVAADWLGDVRRELDARLARFFDDEWAVARALAPEAHDVVEAVRALTMRPGGRLRAAVLVAAFRCVAPARDWRDAVPACAALELLESRLVIHRDWMDHGDPRRREPMLCATFARTGDAHLGASLAILAGDLGSAYAQRLLIASLAGSARREAVLAAFVRMQVEIVLGAGIDRITPSGASRDRRAVAGPLRLGAILGGGTCAQVDALTSLGEPLGEAFAAHDERVAPDVRLADRLDRALAALDGVRLADPGRAMLRDVVRALGLDGARSPETRAGTADEVG